MGCDEIATLARSGRLGTHAYNHLPLAGLNSDAVEREIGESMDVLEQFSGIRVRGISYPYGGKSAVSDQVFSVAQTCGLRYGFTMERGVNAHGDFAYPYQLKRVDTYDVQTLIERAVSGAETHRTR